MLRTFIALYNRPQDRIFAVDVPEDVTKAELNEWLRDNTEPKVVYPQSWMELSDG